MSDLPLPADFPPELLPYASSIRPYLLPSLRLGRTEDTGDPAQSYLGGQIRYWPGDFNYPRDKHKRMLSFLAQLNFAQMPPLPNFPGEGLLQLFINEWDYTVRGVYHPVVTDSAALWSQADIEVLIQGEHYAKTEAEPLSSIKKPGALAFTPMVLPPDPTDPAFETAFAHIEAIRVMPPYEPPNRTHRGETEYHKQYSRTPYIRYRDYTYHHLFSAVGGYSRSPQRNDPRLELPADHDWIVLLKLMEEEDFGMRWGDVQEFHVFIQRHRLQQRDFSQLWLYIAA